MISDGPPLPVCAWCGRDTVHVDFEGRRKCVDFRCKKITLTVRTKKGERFIWTYEKYDPQPATIQDTQRSVEGGAKCAQLPSAVKVRHALQIGKRKAAGGRRKVRRVLPRSKSGSHRIAKR